MSTYLIPIKTAIILFPILAAIITIPYIIHQYRKYGAILFKRVLIVYSFIFYLLCCYFLISLPLPPFEEVRQYTNPTMQLIPFRSIMDLQLTSTFVWDNPATYLSVLNEPSIYMTLFNVVMTIPFGVYLRYYFCCSWKKTLLLSFLLTLSFECIQLSALFGIYPRPYRIFDVDDLITNTLGGMIGYALTPLLVHYLPTREKLDEESLSKGKHVSSFRRVMAFFTDILLVLACSYLFYKLYTNVYPNTSLEMINVNAYSAYFIVVFLYFFILPIFLNGRTIGKAMVKIRLAQLDEVKPKWYQYSLHYFLLYLIVIPAPYLIFQCIVEFFTVQEPYTYLWGSIGAIVFIFYFISMLQVLVGLFDKTYFPWYARLAKLRNYSTIKAINTDDPKVVSADEIIPEVAEENKEKTNDSTDDVTTSETPLS